jgi:hypothetical protein
MNKLAGIWVVVFVLAAMPNLLCQTWPPEKEEVWGAVQNVWSRWTKGDVGYLGDDFRGWNTGRHAPYTKDEIVPWIKEFHEKNDIVLYDIHPLAIDLHGDIAIAFYTYQMLVENTDGSQREERGQWTDIYRKMNGEWILISEAGHILSGGS